MAIRKSILQFEGQMGGMNAYLPKNRKEEDGYIIRKNGGPNAKQIAKLPSCEQVRENNQVFAQCSRIAKSFRFAISPLQHLADVNLAARFTALSRHMLTAGNDGKPRNSLDFSTIGYMLGGFSLNQRHLFDSVVRHPLTATLHRDTGSAEVNVPVLQPDVSLVLPWQQPVYRLIISLGTAGEKITQEHDPVPVSWTSPWYVAQQRIAANTIPLQMEGGTMDQAGCLIVGVGIEMGNMLSDAVIDSVKYMGCGKILLAG
jgi:hypothetical protein